jgi:hypothetical protein
MLSATTHLINWSTSIKHMEKKEPSWSLKCKTHQSMVLLLLRIIIKLRASLRSHRFTSATRLMLDCIYSTLQSLTELKIDQPQLREKSSPKWLKREKFSRWFYQDTGWTLANHTITCQAKPFTWNHRENQTRMLWQLETTFRVMLLSIHLPQLTQLLLLVQM